MKKKKKSLLTDQERKDLLELKKKLEDLKNLLNEGKEKFDKLEQEKSLIIFKDNNGNI